MARRFRLRIGLQLPPGSKGKYLEANAEVSEDELPGLDADALLAGNFVEELPTDYVCAACQEDGTAAQKKKRYQTLDDLRDHYGAEHPALAAPQE